ncbi:unnamed protein product [Auanema sp. JU1783]|nr:unnamed protein product [Auanema sp. JU1783]
MTDTSQHFFILRRCTFGLTKEELEIWNSEAKVVIGRFETLLCSLSEHFWNTVTQDECFLNSFASALNSLPTGYDNELFSVFYEWEEHISETACHLKCILLSVYLRIAVFNEVMDSDLGRQRWQNLITKQEILPLSFETSLWSRYPAKRSLFAKIFKNRLRITETLNKRSREFVERFGQMNERLGEHLDVLITRFKESSKEQKFKYAKLVDDYLNTVVDHIRMVHSTFLVFTESSMAFSYQKLFIAGLADLLEIISCSLTIEDIHELSFTFPNYPLKRFFRYLVTIETEGASLFHSVLEKIKTTERLELIRETAVNERFIFYLFRKFDVNKLLADAERNEVQSLIDPVYMVQMEETVQKLGKQGLLKNLGNLDRLEQSHRDAIQEIREIFPHMSVEYVQLVLGHFKFSTAEALEGLLQKETALPFDLVTVENAILNRPDIKQTLPMVSFAATDLLEKTIPTPKRTVVKEPGAGSMFKGFFSLAPNKKDEASNEETTPDITETLKELRASLDRLRVATCSQPSVGDKKVQVGINGEKLVPMAASKKYGIGKYKVTEEDKIAIRPTYESYKMELQDDTYNDEYDDGYEAREFQVEPLNEELPKPKDNDEDDEEDGEEDTIAPPPAISSRGGSVRRGGNSTRGNRGKNREQSIQGAQGNDSNPSYTGGRDRQMKERHKNDMKQRGADRKRRGGMF